MLSFNVLLIGKTAHTLPEQSWALVPGMDVLFVALTPRGLAAAARVT